LIESHTTTHTLFAYLEFNRKPLSFQYTALIDQKLRDTLDAFFVDGRSSKKLLDDPNAPLGTFSSRLEACYALGLIDNYEHSEINLLRKVRNDFAHSKHGISFKTERIAGLCSTLISSLPEGEGYPLTDPRFRFMNAIVCIVLRYLSRYGPRQLK
jgi:DNA-binding MltR family transcriptional regulator